MLHLGFTSLWLKFYFDFDGLLNKILYFLSIRFLTLSHFTPPVPFPSFRKSNFSLAIWHLKTNLALWAFWQVVTQFFQREGTGNQSMVTEVITLWHWKEIITIWAFMRGNRGAYVTFLHLSLHSSRHKSTLWVQLSPIWSGAAEFLIVCRHKLTWVEKAFKMN